MGAPPARRPPRAGVCTSHRSGPPCTPVTAPRPLGRPRRPLRCVGGMSELGGKEEKRAASCDGMTSLSSVRPVDAVPRPGTTVIVRTAGCAPSGGGRLLRSFGPVAELLVLDTEQAAVVVMIDSDPREHRIAWRDVRGGVVDLRDPAGVLPSPVPAGAPAAAPAPEPAPAPARLAAPASAPRQRRHVPVAAW